MHGRLQSLILVMLVAVGAAMMYLYFVIVPLMMAYFVIFLMAPILDILEMRPYASPCGAIGELRRQGKWSACIACGCRGERPRTPKGSLL